MRDCNRSATFWQPETQEESQEETPREADQEGVQTNPQRQLNIQTQQIEPLNQNEQWRRAQIPSSTQPLMQQMLQQKTQSPLQNEWQNYSSNDLLLNKDVSEHRNSEAKSHMINKKRKLDYNDLSECRNLLKSVRRPGVTPSTILKNGQTASEFAWQHTVQSHLSRAKRSRNVKRPRTDASANTSKHKASG